MLRARKPQQVLDFAIPTINIVFLLLLSFIAAGSQSNRPEMSLSPPTSALLTPDRLPRPLLSLEHADALFLDGVAMSEAGLIATIRQRRIEDAARFPALNILAEQSLPARDLLALVDRIRSDSALSDLAIRIVTIRPAAGA